MITPEWVFVALGSNEGDRRAFLAEGRDGLAAIPNTEFCAATAIEETAPIGDPEQRHYLNQMVLLRTSLSPRALLEHCHRIENQAGRVRRERWGSRTLDLDIVLYGEREVREPDLTVPHPELSHRPFWLRQLAALAPSVRRNREALVSTAGR